MSPLATSMTNVSGSKSKYVKAKAKCRLNQKDIEMAKKLGIGPRTLMKNVPNPQQRWKAPVKVWIQSLYDKRFRSS